MVRTPKISVGERKRKKLPKRRQKKDRRQIFPIRRHSCSFRYSANNDTQFRSKNPPVDRGWVFLLMGPQPTRFSLKLVSDDFKNLGIIDCTVQRISPRASTECDNILNGA